MVFVFAVGCVLFDVNLFHRNYLSYLFGRAAAVIRVFAAGNVYNIFFVNYFSGYRCFGCILFIHCACAAFYTVVRISAAALGAARRGGGIICGARGRFNRVK